MTSDDSIIIRRISDARIEIEVQSRRKTVAQQSLPDSLETARQGVIKYYQILIARADELVASRLKAHQAFFAARFDTDSLRAWLISVGFGGYMQNPTLLFAEHTRDTIAAAQCKPRFVWAINGASDRTGFTVQRLQEDVTRLTECESALTAEAAQVYDFEPQPES